MPPVEAKGKASVVAAWVATGALVPAGERKISGAPLVGRGRELGVLQGIWERVADERTPHLVTIFGPPGVGKTRLGLEFGRAVRELGGRPVRGRSLPYRDSSAYGAFAAQLKQFCHIFESDPIEVAQKKLRDAVATLLGPAEADEVAGHLAILVGLDREGSVADRETLFFSVRRFIEAVAGDKPTMLVFEDVHWADSSLLDLIELLAARLRDLPILLLALARPELLDSRPRWGGGLPAYTTLPLDQLKESEARELAAQLLGASANGEQAERAAMLAETGEGNPLFIEQLAATLAESSPSDDSQLPTTIRGIVAARLDALPADERALLLDAAVGGKVFWRGALERMTDDPEGLSRLLGALEERDLIRRQSVSAIEGDQQFMFKHVLIRDVAYDLLPRARRRERHAQVAQFIEEATSETGEAAAALARHWRDAGDQERAIEHVVMAAEEGGARLGEGTRRLLLPGGPRTPSGGRRRAAKWPQKTLGAGPHRGVPLLGRATSAGKRLARSGEVRGRYVSCDLPHIVDGVLPEALRVLVDRLFVRRDVDAVRLNRASVVDDHVTVFPGDLRELLFDNLLRASTDGRHRILGDVERSQNQVSRHVGHSTCG
jgi:hypothetical protein